MNSYNLDAICPKCRCQEIKSVYHNAGIKYDSYHQTPIKIAKDLSLPLTGGIIGMFSIEKARIERTCCNCGYSWDEEPLDAKESINTGETK